MRKLLKILLTTISILVLLNTTNSCRKIYGPKSCFIEKSLTGINLLTGKLKSSSSYNTKEPLFENDTSCYDLYRISMALETKIINEGVCSKPIDSIIGKLDHIYIICSNYYNQSFSTNDTINEIITVVYSLNQKEPVALNEYLKLEQGNKGLFFFLSAPPDSINLQEFIVIYKESNGNTYSDTTTAVYITP